MTYGWQIGSSPDAAGGAYLHLKEGIGDFESEEIIRRNPKVRAGDFYNASADRRRIEAKIVFPAPAPGSYQLWGRTMAHKSLCSNMLYLSVNDQPEVILGHNGSTPFQWLWHRGPDVILAGGLNSLRLMAHQDDVKVDQIIFLPAGQSLTLQGSDRCGGGLPLLLPAALPNIPKAALSLTADSLVIPPGGTPTLQAFVTTCFDQDYAASLVFHMDIQGGRRQERSFSLRQNSQERLRSYELPPFDFSGGEKREYLCEVSLSGDDGLTTTRSVVFTTGYDWWILGPLPFYAAAERLAPESEPIPQTHYRLGGTDYHWQPFDHTCMTSLSLLDLGRFFSKNSKEPLTNRSAYGTTEIEVMEGGRYRLKAMSDDNLVVWINNQPALTITEKGPAIRTAREAEVELKKGRNRLLFRVNQFENTWQVSLRLRRLDEGLPAILGVPFNEQTLSEQESPEGATMGAPLPTGKRD